MGSGGTDSLWPPGKTGYRVDAGDRHPCLSPDQGCELINAWENVKSVASAQSGRAAILAHLLRTPQTRLGVIWSSRTVN